MKETAIDKIRKIAEWSNDMNEHFNDRVRSMRDWEVIYDTIRSENWAYADNLDASDPVERETMEIVNGILGYNLYEI